MAQQAAIDGATAVQLVDARQSLGLAQLDDLFPEGEAFRASLRTFTVLLVLAAFIASFGLYQDSVASIIGAMVVAPLGGTILAFAGALVTARSRWQWITVLQVLLGALGVIAIGFLVALILPELIRLTPQMDARTAPGLLDLGVALAAGAAGAYVAVRHTGTDALPGVAIAVSLVPPLATAGICLQLGRTDDAAGALLLFAMNFAAIVVAACIVFTLAGAAPERAMATEHRRMRNGVIGAVVLLAAISIPLVATGAQKAFESARAVTAEPYVRAWIGGRNLSVADWEIEGNSVTLDLTGPDAPADAQALASELAGAYGSPVTLTVNYVPTQQDVATGNP
jgi:uncharacterized hydrophobic protein (TIGR00271 family)